ncbi:hypothetical protein [Bradyrhizobium sp. URHD0069]|uniref:hypothetical protein n=1 Tax=Bradyrhizobium sp. URHD0069 TaxID=1380355 RepID=UPI0009DE1625|nr:hypothetical protein [Bradyrhizobium sp. URHD0069]
MTPIKLLSVGLIATAMLATPAMARENYAARRHAAENAYASVPPTARYVYRGDIYGGACIPAPRVGAFATEPWGGGNIPCETGGY